MIGGRTFLAPNQIQWNIRKAVDVGCGTGVATIQLATRLPEAEVYGYDLTPVPEHIQAIAPANVGWAKGNILDIDLVSEADDVMSRKIFKAGTLDYVFGRMLFLGINDWPHYFSTMAHCLRPGGIIEHQDLDWKFYRVGTDDGLSDQWEWHQAVLAGANHVGLSARAGSDAALNMESAGLEVLSRQTYEFCFVPSAKNPSGYTMAMYVQEKLIPQYPELLRKMLGHCGIAGTELRRLTENCLRDISSGKEIYQKYTVTVAKKSWLN
ncbi:MAG: hypothetical protein Q9169_006983 [Polycauliona sp. 2 TL-2023]